MGIKWSGAPLKLLLVTASAVLFAAGVASMLDTPRNVSYYKKPVVAPIPTLPDGSRTLFPKHRLVALYGTPDAPALGALGEQPLTATIARVKELAAAYQPYSQTPMLPTLEIIATIASASPQADGSYSRPVAMKTLQAWVRASQKAGVYVVLDLQPGRDNFLPQAQQLAPLLREPNVGLALDPEWRLGPQQLPLAQIGSADMSDVNQTAAWLAGLTARYNLPQKLFLLQEFRLTMLPDRDQLDTSYPQLSYAIQMDGQGSQAEKLATWGAIIQDPPAGVYFGWKNFITNDTPLLSPQATMALTPTLWYISYQ